MRSVPLLPYSSESDLELSTVRHQPEGLDQLQTQTKFTKKELQSLYRGFKNECPSGLVDEETFKMIYSQFFPQGGKQDRDQRADGSSEGEETNTMSINECAQ
ncbi:UNVERIFIED_CONTAM: hypothetical protein FKN15_019829 [Acipenser sinensis]